MILVLRLILAALSGAGVYLSFEPYGLWWLGVIGSAGLWLTFLPWRGRPVGLAGGALLAFTHSVALYALLLPWIGALVGTMPYVALSIWLSLYSLLLGPGAALLARYRYGFLGFPFFYLAIELLRSSVPFGGFGWVRLAWGQINNPLLIGFARWGSTGLVSLTAVIVGVALIHLVVGKARGAAALALVLTIIPGLIATAQISGQHPDERTVKVAAIQGNVPRLGLDFLGQRRAVLNNHLRVTESAAAAHPDLVIWPENSSDINPFANPDALKAIQSAAKQVQAPVLVGTLTTDEVGEHNTMQVFNADGTPGEHHYKKYLQPFGETMPMREFFRSITNLVDLAGDFKPGNGPGVVNMAGTDVGVATCYEVSFDAAFRTSINNGAQLLTTPTNNATFGFSDMTYQQLAMSRFRAIETDRAVVVAATSGVSAIIKPNGIVTDHTEIFQPAYLVDDLPLRATVTPAVRYGSVIQALAVTIGLLAVAAAAVANRRRPQSISGGAS